MVELMNIPYLGPNIELAPDADPSDGSFDLVLIPKSRRNEVVNFLHNMIKNTREIVKTKEFVKIVRVKKIKMKCDATKMHVDDNLIDNYSGKNIKLDIHSDKLVFVLE